MLRLIRLLKYATYPFLALSILLLLGLLFGAAFVTSFTIENRTDTTVVVTPVGTVGRAGTRAPLPIKAHAFLPLPAMRSGNFSLAPGESTTILYDMDDINFSEIVIFTPRDEVLQLVTNPNPTENQYRGPLQKHFSIDDLSFLQPAHPTVQAAAKAANKQWKFASQIYALLVGPWLAYAVLAWLSRNHPPLRKGQQSI